MSIRCTPSGARHPEGARPDRQTSSGHGFYILEGAVDFVFGEERFRDERGALAYLRRGLPHTFLGVSEQASRVPVLLMPGGLEKLFAQSDPERFSEILREHHVEVVGPPLTV